MSMSTPLFVAAAGLVVLTAGAPLAAHHSFAAEFDGTKLFIGSTGTGAPGDGRGAAGKP